MSTSPKKSVLFVCVGNACRSQMAEAFARAYGADVIDPASAGIWPAMSIPRLTLQVMESKNIFLEGHFPKGLDVHQGKTFDLIVNMSGYPLPNDIEAPVEEWRVDDPIGGTESVHREVRDRIEALVMRLVLTMRSGASSEVDPQPLKRRRRFLRD